MIPMIQAVVSAPVRCIQAANRSRGRCTRGGGDQPHDEQDEGGGDHQDAVPDQSENTEGGVHSGIREHRHAHDVGEHRGDFDKSCRDRDPHDGGSTGARIQQAVAPPRDATRAGWRRRPTCRCCCGRVHGGRRLTAGGSVRAGDMERASSGGRARTRRSARVLVADRHEDRRQEQSDTHEQARDLPRRRSEEVGCHVDEVHEAPEEQQPDRQVERGDRREVEQYPLDAHSTRGEKQEDGDQEGADAQAVQQGEQGERERKREAAEEFHASTVAVTRPKRIGRKSCRVSAASSLRRMP